MFSLDSIHRLALIITFCTLTLTSISRSAELVESPQMTAAEEAIWKLERAYWRYVENNDLPAYSDLWHKNFLGWPSVSARPVHKDHITDWITSETSRALSFKVDEFKPAAIQVTGDVASACYWITFRWQDKDGKGASHTVRITHTWLRTGKDWHIISGMSMPESEPPPK
jgi:ketosteroid isomerase-like protein